MSPTFIWINTVAMCISAAVIMHIVLHYTGVHQSHEVVYKLKIIGLFVNFTMDSPKFIVNEFLQLRLHQIPV